jgi:serine/threonine-protein phosphatase PP1 catalytic subunit
MTSKRLVIEELRQLLPNIHKVFASEPAVLKTSVARAMIVADIHDDISTLEYILQKWKESGCSTIIFLGDYVDRGRYGPEVLVRLFNLKLSDPKHVLLLRGNHEEMNMNVHYGFFDEINRDIDLLYDINEVYEVMPIAAILANKVFCVHGGIDEAGIISRVSKSNSFQYLWNDPTNEYVGFSRSRRGSIVREFGPDVVDRFLDINKLKMIIRGHTATMEGYEWWFDGKLLSLFSAPNYSGLSNRAAYVIYESGEVNLFTFKNARSATSKVRQSKKSKSAPNGMRKSKRSNTR